MVHRSGLGAALAAALGVAAGCRTSGTAWMNEPISAPADDVLPSNEAAAPPGSSRAAGSEVYRKLEGRVISEAPPPPPAAAEAGPRAGSPEPSFQGRVLGVFRNTYYDFPAEGDYKGEKVSVRDAECKPIKEVARGFYEALCVQGSGTLSDGATVSFAKRDCECAEICPRTNQRICFERLDRSEYPWGRGATGKPITPLITVAVDSDVVPLGTPIYIPEFDGAPREPSRTSFHDGCFIAQDRGLRVKGKQVDIFTGQESVTKLWNQLVPSNGGVRVVLDEPKCARAAPVAVSAEPSEEPPRKSRKRRE